MKGGSGQVRRPWTEIERAVLRKFYPDAPTFVIAKALGRPLTQVYRQARRLDLLKSAAYLASEAACRLRRGDHIGAAFQFPRGHQPWNKGKKGLSMGGLATRFKAGAMPHNHVPIGTEVKDRDGYLKRKIAEPKTWVYVHRYEWERVHGPIPKTHALAFKDGNKANVSLNNLELRTKREVMLRNSVHNLPPELVEVIQLQGALKRKINGKHRRAA